MGLKEFLEIYDQIPEDYSIGIHGVTRSDNMIETANSILDKGLSIYGWGGLLSNIKMFGQKKKINDSELSKLLNYFYGHTDYNEIFTNIIFAFPEKLKDINNKDYFLGHFNKNTGYAKTDDEAGASLPINKMSENISSVPKEFIVGYIIQKLNSNYFNFIINPDFIEFMTEEDKINYFETIKDKLTENGMLDKDNYSSIISRLNSFGFEIEEYHKQIYEYYKKQKGSKKII